MTPCGKWFRTRFNALRCFYKLSAFLPVSPLFRANLHLVYGADVYVILIMSSQPRPCQAFVFQPLLMPSKIKFFRVCVRKEVLW